jgi:hypothetical protein
MKRLDRPGKTGSEHPVAFLYSQSRFAMGRKIVYDYYECDDRQAARQFLETAAIPAGFHYLVVITPEGAIGRDTAGIYNVIDQR